MIKRPDLLSLLFSQRRGGVFLHPERPAGFTQLRQTLQTQRYGGPGAASEGAGDRRSEGEEGVHQLSLLTSLADS